MTREELIAAVPVRESQGRLYVRLDDVPAPWRAQLTAAMIGSAFVAVQGFPCCAGLLPNSVAAAHQSPRPISHHVAKNHYAPRPHASTQGGYH